MNLLLLFAVSLTPYFLGNQTCKDSAYIIYLIHAVIGIFVCYRKRDLFLFLSPNALVFFYVTFSMALGSWGFANEYVLSESFLLDYKSFKHNHIATSLTMICTSTILAVDYFHHKHFIKRKKEAQIHSNNYQMAASLILIPFFFFPIDLTLFGGSGDFSILPKSAFAILAIILINRLPRNSRWVLYAFLILAFSAFSINEKREAIFLIIPIAYIELLQNNYKLSLKTIAVAITTGTFLLFLILSMSIARGYGGFGESQNLMNAIPHLFSYITSDIFVAAFLNNIEANYFYFHSTNSIEMVIQNQDLVSYGSTISKPLFIPFPRDAVDWKPESIISLYTHAYDPSFRERGGSWPINIFSETIWNFHIFAPIAAGILGVSLSYLNLHILKKATPQKTFSLAFYLFTYMHILTLARGSGTDLYAIYLAIGGMSFFACFCVYRFTKYRIP